MKRRRGGTWWRPALSFVGVMTLTASLGLGLARVTGDSPRAYPVLSPDDGMTIGGSLVTVDEIARQYRPRIVELPQDRPDPVVGLSYEAWRDGSDLLVTYFVAWADEVHPSPVADTMYGLYRWAYYRGRQDVEYVQVRISPTGEVSQVRFESAADLDPWTPRPVHVDAVVEPVGTILRRTLAEGDGDRPLQVDVAPPVDSTVVLFVATWNHLLDVVPPPPTAAEPSSPGNVPKGLPVPVPRSAGHFEQQAGARRGHPSPDNVETTGRAFLGRTGGLLFVGSPLIALAAVLVHRRTPS